MPVSPAASTKDLKSAIGNPDFTPSLLKIRERLVPTPNLCENFAPVVGLENGAAGQSEKAVTAGTTRMNAGLTTQTGVAVKVYCLSSSIPPDQLGCLKPSRIPTSWKTTI